MRGKRISKGGKTEDGASTTEGDGGKADLTVVSFQSFYFSDCGDDQPTLRPQIT